MLDDRLRVGGNSHAVQRPEFDEEIDISKEVFSSRIGRIRNHGSDTIR